MVPSALQVMEVYGSSGCAPVPANTDLTPAKLQPEKPYYTPSPLIYLYLYQYIHI